MILRLLPELFTTGLCGLDNRIRESYESFMVAAKILVYTLIKPKIEKKSLKNIGNRLGLELEDFLLWFPLCSRSVSRGSP